jgi:hypothetical protein
MGSFLYSVCNKFSPGRAADQLSNILNINMERTLCHV